MKFYETHDNIPSATFMHIASCTPLKICLKVHFLPQNGVFEGVRFKSPLFWVQMVHFFRALHPKLILAIGLAALNRGRGMTYMHTQDPAKCASWYSPTFYLMINVKPKHCLNKNITNQNLPRITSKLSVVAKIRKAKRKTSYVSKLVTD